MSRPYTRLTCHVCGKEISQAGCAKTAHFRMHVRQGIMQETTDRDGYLQFERIKRPTAST